MPPPLPCAVWKHPHRERHGGAQPRGLRGDIQGQQPTRGTPQGQQPHEVGGGTPRDSSPPTQRQKPPRGPPAPRPPLCRKRGPLLSLSCHTCAPITSRLPSPHPSDVTRHSPPPHRTHTHSPRVGSLQLRHTGTPKTSRPPRRRETPRLGDVTRPRRREPPRFGDVTRAPAGGSPGDATGAPRRGAGRPRDVV